MDETIANFEHHRSKHYRLNENNISGFLNQLFHVYIKQHGEYFRPGTPMYATRRKYLEYLSDECVEKFSGFNTESQLFTTLLDYYLECVDRYIMDNWFETLADMPTNVLDEHVYAKSRTSFFNNDFKKWWKRLGYLTDSRQLTFRITLD